MSIHRENGGSGPQIIPTSSFPWTGFDFGLAVFLIFAAIAGAMLADHLDEAPPVTVMAIDQRMATEHARRLVQAYQEGQRAALAARADLPDRLSLHQACLAGGWRQP